jgi:SOS response associated peptidase (SRAP)
MFRKAYRKRRCIVPIDSFFEWMAIKGAKVKQPYAIAMQDRSPFGLAGLWENWKNPASGEWVRTFCITASANELVGRIHDPMPAILRPEDYGRWLAVDPDGPDLLQAFPSEPMEIWPISTRVNSSKNDDADLLKPLADADACWPKDGNSADEPMGTRRMAAGWKGERRSFGGGCDEGRRLSGIWQILLAHHNGSCGSRYVRSGAHAGRSVRRGEQRNLDERGTPRLGA